MAGNQMRETHAHIAAVWVWLRLQQLEMPQHTPAQRRHIDPWAELVEELRRLKALQHALLIEYT